MCLYGQFGDTWAPHVVRLETPYMGIPTPEKEKGSVWILRGDQTQPRPQNTDDLRHMLPTPLSCHPYQCIWVPALSCGRNISILNHQGALFPPATRQPLPTPYPCPALWPPFPFPPAGRSREHGAREHLFPPICWWRPAGNDNQDLPGSRTCPGPRFLSTETAQHKDWPFESLKNLLIH